MEKRKSTRRTKNLVVICTLTAIILVVSTYAWFIGMRSVAVSSFDVEIATTDSLLLSLDGAKWSTNVNINAENFNDTENTVYDNHTNAWSQLIPMSSIGEMDSTVSRMKLYEKASFTATAGGYRLMASRVNNYQTGNPEQEGYVVFDLFVKNFSGTQYLPELNQLDEEAIYLTRDSKVTVASDGVSNTGIENSVRVAFTQIGRVAGTTTDPDNITSIKCTSDSANESTGICRDAQIWEPNDIMHVDSAINWYSTSCKKRNGEDVNDVNSYSKTENCVEIANGTSYPTYAVMNNIASSDNIDIYDGVTGKYNGYGINSVKVKDFPYFTDTMKNKLGVDRPQFMTLAPNSITKLRIYIYIEGQDIDNYDFAQIGKKIAVNFGFTKERFDDADKYSVDYTGPSLNVPVPNNEIVANHVDLANNKINQ